MSTVSHTRMMSIRQTYFPLPLLTHSQYTITPPLTHIPNHPRHRHLPHLPGIPPQPPTSPLAQERGLPLQQPLRIPALAASSHNPQPRRPLLPVLSGICRHILSGSLEAGTSQLRVVGAGHRHLGCRSQKRSQSYLCISKIRLHLKLKAIDKNTRNR